VKINTINELRVPKRPQATNGFSMRHSCNQLRLLLTTAIFILKTFMPITALSMFGCETEEDQKNSPTPAQTPSTETTPLTLNCEENADCYVEKKYEDQGICFVDTDKKSNTIGIKCENMMEYNYTFLIFALQTPIEITKKATVHLKVKDLNGIDLNLSGQSFSFRMQQNFLSVRAAGAYAIEVGKDIQTPGGFNYSYNFLTFEDDTAFEGSHAIDVSATDYPISIAYLAVEFMSPSDFFFAEFESIKFIF